MLVEAGRMKHRWLTLACCVLLLSGCKVDAQKIKVQGKGRNAAQRQSIQDNTGVDLGTATPARGRGGKLRLTSAPADL